jgi:outer membrane protein OmpA-like peptidoglycan-associated protein
MTFFSRLFLAGVMLCLTVHVADAQIIRSSQTPYARVGAGTSVSETDRSTYAVEPYSLYGEAGYQLTRSLGFGLGVTYADYPKANDANSTMTTLQGLVRWTLFPDWPTTPYLNTGPHVTLGGDNPASGVVFGLGVDRTLSRRTSLFLEATAYATFPDDAIDSRDDGRATFDGLGFWGAGVRTSLNAAPTPVRLHPIDGRRTAYRGEPVTFTARAFDDASPPIEYAWSMGDGASERGLVVDHTYRLEGTYRVAVTATNDGGSDTQTIEVTVVEPQQPARVIALAADTLTVRTHELIRFSAQVQGTAPLDAAWSFGDDTAPVIERGEHTYDDDRYIGRVKQNVRQGYVYDTPGTYTVSLTTANRFGTDERSVVVEVVPGAQRLLATTEPDPCLEPAPADTVYFAFDSAHVSDRAAATLQRASTRLQQCPNLLIRLDGYADWVGRAPYNRTLSERRAAAVRDFYAEAGIDASRFIVRGNGEIQPPCPAGHAGRGCAPFRRVESVIVFEDDVPLAERSSTAPAPVAPAQTTGHATDRGWAVIVGSMESRADAQTLADRMKETLGSGVPVRVLAYNEDVGRYRVALGPYVSQSAAQSVKSRYAGAVPADAWLMPATLSDVLLTDAGR